ncbi:SDR family NAD(P)-dependent oxidoreductase [Wenjunlia tyrosinilytica]|uniref:Dehydrogenase n=1 Tax=Wenjunlia tyrosinilytica TaxID=1544741 RepID=A0A917ZW01_9ACTN|nr:SDR family oxidoreductase [Wenjunlia tyrosinilytica]GGO94746.1 dehydrogenase [Wenjunlia tyrosinilytica]
MQHAESRLWDLKDKAIVVTGASSGIGAQIAKTMAAAGARVLLVARDAGRLAACAEDITAAGGECEVCQADVTAPDAAEHVVAAALRVFGRIDCLVNNAGVFTMKPFTETGTDELDAQYATNVRAPYALTRAAVPHMGRGSTVVFVGSNLAQLGLAGTAAYSASKGAVESMARALAVELSERGIRVNTVAPGIIRTPMTSYLDDPSALAAETRRTPAGRVGAPQDVAAAVLYLSSQASGFMVGSVLTVDGGISAY